MDHQVLHELVKSVPAGVHTAVKAKEGQIKKLKFLHVSLRFCYSPKMTVMIEFIMKSVLNHHFLRQCHKAASQVYI